MSHAGVRVALRRAQSAPTRLNSYKGRHIVANFSDGVITVSTANLSS
jgi:hypothetical protein